MNKNINKYDSSAVSLARFVSMISIVACHICQGLDNDCAWILNIGVQIFFFISGYLYGGGNIVNRNKWYLRRIIRIYIPFFIYINVVSLILLIKEPDEISLRYYSVLLLNMQGITRSYPGLEHLWFLTWIIICYALTPFLDKSKNVVLIVSIFVCLSFVNIKALYVCLYILAYNITKYKMLDNLSYKLLVLASSIVVLYFFNWEDIVIFKSLYCQAFHIILSIGIVTAILLLIRKLEIETNNTLLIKHVNSISYEIYITHHLFILSPSFSILFITKNVLFNIFFIVLATLATSILLHVISDCVISKIKYKFNI